MKNIFNDLTDKLMKDSTLGLTLSISFQAASTMGYFAFETLQDTIAYGNPSFFGEAVDRFTQYYVSSFMGAVSLGMTVGLANRLYNAEAREDKTLPLRIGAAGSILTAYEVMTCMSDADLSFDWGDMTAYGVALGIAYSVCKSMNSFDLYMADRNMPTKVLNI